MSKKFIIAAILAAAVASAGMAACQKTDYELISDAFGNINDAISAEKLMPDAPLYGRFDGNRAFRGFDFQIFHNTRLTKFCLRIK